MFGTISFFSMKDTTKLVSHLRRVHFLLILAIFGVLVTSIIEPTGEVHKHRLPLLSCVRKYLATLIPFLLAAA